MLRKALSAFMPDEAYIIDDGSDFAAWPTKHFHRVPHAGKAGFWRNWNYALKLCRASEDDLFIFTQDDLLHVDYDRIQRLHEEFKHEPYALNIQYDGRLICWTKYMPTFYRDDIMRVGFVDCMFACNRAALEAINWKVDTVPHEWTKNHTSSGVGRNITHQFTNAGVQMFTTLRSIGYHGDHESKMHPEERKRVPLISKQ